MVLWRFVETLPADVEGGWFAHYEHVVLAAPGWRRIDVRAMLRPHQEAWIDAYDEWHAAVCRLALQCSRWWWFAPASRPNLWLHENVLKPLYFAAALEAWARHHPECRSVHVLGCPPEVGWYLSGMLGQGTRLRERLALALRWLRALRLTVRDNAARAILYARRYVGRQPPQLRAQVIFYSHVLQAKSLEEDGDHFFGTMLDVVADAMPGEVLTAYLLSQEAEREQASRVLRTARPRSVFLLDFLTWRDWGWAVARAAWMCLSLARLSWRAPSICIGPLTTRLFAQLFMTEQVVRYASVEEFMIYRAMKRLLACSSASVMVYPYEEKGLERAILTACAEAPRPIRTVGYAHAAHTTCHLALRARPGTSSKPPHPSIILTTGPKAREFLVGWGRRQPHHVVAVGSPRHLSRLKGHQTEALNDRPLRILAFDSLWFELPMLASMLEERPGLFAAAEVVIRPYSFAWQQVQDRAIARMMRVSDRVRVQSDSLANHLRWCDVALFGTTSAGVQAMLSGCLAIYVQLHDLFEADPLLGEQAAFARCASAGELVEALTRARQLGPTEREAVIQRQHAYAEALFAPIDQEQLIRHVGNGHPQGGAAAEAMTSQDDADITG